MKNCDNKGRKADDRREDDLDDEDDLDAGGDDEDMDDDEDSTQEDSKGVPTDVFLTDDAALAQMIEKAVSDVIGPLVPILKGLPAEITRANNRIAKVYKSLGAALDQNEEIREELKEIQKGLSGLDSMQTLVKGLSAAYDGASKTAPATRPAQGGSNAEAKVAGVLQKGDLIVDPTASATPEAALTEAERVHAAQVLEKALTVRDRFQQNPDGLTEATHARNHGTLRPEHIERLEKGISVLESAA